MGHQFERGQYFEDTRDPHVDGMVVLEAGNIGYDGYRVAEKDHLTGRWRRYWIKDRHLHDDVNLGAIKPTRELGEDMLQSVEQRCDESDREISTTLRRSTSPEAPKPSAD